jgi:anti-anti-sigma regulatory factor
MFSFDLRAILERTVSRIHGDLVTRPTGAAVRTGIEQSLAELDGEQTAIIDFSTIRTLDLSCADEVVGKLLRAHGRARYFVLKGVSPAQRDAIEQVLDRHQLAVVARDRDGRFTVLGHVSDAARRALELITERGSAAADEIASALDLPADVAAGILEELREQRLLLQSADRFSPVPLG